MLNQALRYRRVTELLAAEPAGTLLEVGSGSRGIAGLISPAWKITSLDRSFDDYGATRTGSGDGVERVIGDVTALPFADRSFDAVVALDLMEHVPGELRAKALDELGRVAANVTIVGCPCGPAALESDRRLAARYERLRGQAPGWLTEHLENGFPTAAELAAGLSPHGDVTCFDNESVGAHERIGTLEALPLAWTLSGLAARALGGGRSGVGRPRVDALRGAVARRLRGGDTPPSYRTIALLRRSAA